MADAVIYPSLSVTSWGKTKTFFEITDISVEQPVIVYGETARMQITVKNVSGIKVTKIQVWGYSTIPIEPYTSMNVVTETVSSRDYYAAGSSDSYQTVSWLNNATMTFDCEIPILARTLIYPLALPEYHWGANKANHAPQVTPADIGIRFEIDTTNTVKDGSDTHTVKGRTDNVNFQGSANEFIHILTARDNPVLFFKGKRYDLEQDSLSDEGRDIQVEAHISFDSDVIERESRQLEPDSTTYSISTSCVPTVSGGVGFDFTLSDLATGDYALAWSTNQQYNNGTDYLLTLRVANAYESASFPITIPRAFANVHMSGATYVENNETKQIGGVAFGKFSSVKSTSDASGKNSAKFECVYPAFFSNGIDFRSEIKSPTIASGFATPGDYGQALSVTKVGNVVFMNGTIKRTTSGSTIVGYLPNGYAPSDTVYFLSVGTGNYIARVGIYSDGSIELNWVHSHTSTTNITSTLSWLSFNVFWFV